MGIKAYFKEIFRGGYTGQEIRDLRKLVRQELQSEASKAGSTGSLVNESLVEERVRTYLTCGVLADTFHS